MELLHDRPDFSVLIGNEELLVASMKLGAFGGVCGGLNLNPKLLMDRWNAILARRHETSRGVARRSGAHGPRPVSRRIPGHQCLSARHQGRLVACRIVPR